MFNEFIEELKEKEIVITFSNGKLQYCLSLKNISQSFLNTTGLQIVII
jgi:hypothetical protein